MTNHQFYGVIPPLLTPFKHNGDVDFDKFARNLEKLNDVKLAAYLVLGSKGEAAFLTEDEKVELVKLTVSVGRAACPVLAGTGLESARATIRFTNKLANLGVHGAMILTPCYYAGQMTEDALIRFYTEVGDRVAIPIYIYNVPKFTHLNISVRTVSLLSQHPNILGIKDTSGDLAQLLCFQLNGSPSFQVMAGTASLWLPALMLRIQTAVLALANVAPAECCRVQSLLEEGQAEHALQLYLRLLPVNIAVTTTHGVAGLKYAADLMGFEGGEVRLPLLPLPEGEKAVIRKTLTNASLL